MVTKKAKKFDCLVLKDRAQAEILRKLRALSPEEQRAYLRRAAEEGPLGEWWKRVQAVQEGPVSSGDSASKA